MTAPHNCCYVRFNSVISRLVIGIIYPLSIYQGLTKYSFFGEGKSDTLHKFVATFRHVTLRASYDLHQREPNPYARLKIVRRNPLNPQPRIVSSHHNFYINLRRVLCKTPMSRPSHITTIIINELASTRKHFQYI